MEKDYFQDDEELFDIRYDRIFKAVFTKDDPMSQGALSGLVSALIERDVSIVSIRANEPPIGNQDDRLIRFDINCKAQNGELINVEMCLNPKISEAVRLEYYLGVLFTGQGIKGKDKDYKDLNQAYQIAIIANQRLMKDDVFLHNFEYYDPRNKISLDGKCRIITLELTKLKAIVEKPVEAMTSSERWAIFFEYLTDKSKRSKIIAITDKDEGIRMASGVWVQVSHDEEERARIMRDHKYELDHQSEVTRLRREARTEGREEGREEGRTEGLEEGRTEGRTIALEETAKKMKEMGLTPEQIKMATGIVL